MNPLTYNEFFKLRKNLTPLKSPPLPGNAKHRASCHRCGNLRQYKVYCVSCTATFCAKCADKMVNEHGVVVFEDGCPVCHQKCCCAEKSPQCSRKYHCYKKCLHSKRRINRNRQKRIDKIRDVHTSEDCPHDQTATLFDFPSHIASSSLDMFKSKKQDREKQTKQQNDTCVSSTLRLREMSEINSGSTSDKNSSQHDIESVRSTNAVQLGAVNSKNSPVCSNGTPGLSNNSISTSATISSTGDQDNSAMTYFDSIMSKRDTTNFITSDIAWGAIQNSISAALLFSNHHNSTSSHRDNGSQQSLFLSNIVAPPPEELSFQHIFSLSSTSRSLSIEDDNNDTAKRRKDDLTVKFADKVTNEDMQSISGDIDEYFNSFLQQEFSQHLS